MNVIHRNDVSDVMKYCPNCGKQMQFNEIKEEWYCYSCNGFSLSNKTIYEDDCIIRISNLNMIIIISLILIVVACFFFIIGNMSLNYGLRYASFDFESSEYTVITTNDNINNGLFITYFSILLVLGVKIIMSETVEKKSWFQELGVGNKCYSPLATQIMKRRVMALIQIFYGAIIIFGIILISIGFLMAIFWSWSNDFSVHIPQIIIGFLLIFTCYLLYQEELKYISKYILPIITQLTIKRK